MEVDFSHDKNFALQMDQKDPLSNFRNHFFIPDGSLYMDGNSLGLLSKESEYSLKTVKPFREELIWSQIKRVEYKCFFASTR